MGFIILSHSIELFGEGESLVFPKLNQKSFCKPLKLKNLESHDRRKLLQQAEKNLRRRLSFGWKQSVGRVAFDNWKNCFWQYVFPKTVRKQSFCWNWNPLHVVLLFFVKIQSKTLFWTKRQCFFDTELTFVMVSTSKSTKHFLLVWKRKYFFGASFSFTVHNNFF